MSLHDSDAWQGPDGGAGGGENARQGRGGGASAAGAARPARVIRRRLRITGLVQGVGFRYEAVRTARRLGLVGWVRNRLDGSVEIEAQGPAERVEEMIACMGQGPRWSRVDDVTVASLAPLPPGRVEETFQVMRSQ